MKSNFSKLLFSIFLCILIIFMDIPLCTKADSIPLTFVPVRGLSYTFYGDGEYYIDVMFSLKKDEIEGTTTYYTFKELTYAPNYRDAIEYAQETFYKYDGFTMIMMCAVPSNGLPLNFKNKSNQNLNISITASIESIKLPFIDPTFSEKEYPYIEGNSSINSPMNLTLTLSPNEYRQYTMQSLSDRICCTTSFMGDSTSLRNTSLPLNAQITMIIKYKLIITSSDSNSLITEFKRNELTNYNITTYTNGMLFYIMRPFEIPDYRFLVALQNIWSAINGSNSNVNLVDTITQQTQQQTNTLTNGFDNTAGNNAVQDIQGEINKLQQAEAGADQAKNALKNIDFDSYMDFTEAGNGIVFLTTTANSIFTAIPQLKAIVIAGFLILLISIIIGLRRFF